MEEHLIFYVDILGFRAAIERPEGDHHEAIKRMLREVAEWRGAIELRLQLKHSKGEFRIRPEISTFSDHVVLSYAVEDFNKVDANLTMGLASAEGIIPQFAREAMTLGFLIRGGVTVGPLYHENGVVVGRAMIEAWELESKVAIYPRIVVSRRLYSRLPDGEKNGYLLRDRDGIAHYNYIRPMIWSSFWPQKKDDIAWLADVRSTVAENVAKFEAEEKWNEFAKWSWFANTLEEQTNRLSRHAGLGK